MRIIAESSITIAATGVAERLIINGVLPAATKITGVLVRAGASNAAAALIGRATPNHYVASSDQRGFIIYHDISGDLMVKGTQNDVIHYTVYGGAAV